MKRLFIIAAGAAFTALLTGCTGAGFAKGMNAIASDNAVVEGKYNGVYGPITVLRANARPGQNVSMSSDGSVTITWVGTNATTGPLSVPMTARVSLTSSENQTQPSPPSAPLAK
jgi:hypothetical protein